MKKLFLFGAAAMAMLLGSWGFKGHQAFGQAQFNYFYNWADFECFPLIG